MTDLTCLASPLAPEVTRALPVVGGTLAAAGLLPLARRLSALSPAKTWGGLVGSAALAALALWALGEWTPLRWLVVACGCAVGGLLESVIKRGAGVKDAGRRLPGFGGLLDRIDSLLVTLLLLGVTL
ncbi:phosphatidate cytidylyltransferase [Streptomyces noursei]|uniref:phosphatidate cytidylyltransferase n=1 Tax=Streptomyces noursei TaxID=1971 RepID=UPI0030EFD3A7